MLHILRSRPVISGTVFALIGLYFAGAGSWLAVLGGTWYYAIAGFGLIATGVLLILGRRLALAVYGLVWLYTVIWAFGESGIDPWYLMPRLLAPTLLGVYLLMPRVTRSLSPPSRGLATWAHLAGGTAAVLLIGLLT
jgi:quinoprotein glucose dehydrogenase